MSIPKGSVGSERRLEIITALDEAEKLLERAARLIKREGDCARSDRTLDIAQQASGMKCLLDQDWRETDATQSNPS